MTVGKNVSPVILFGGLQEAPKDTRKDQKRKGGGGGKKVTEFADILEYKICL